MGATPYFDQLLIQQPFVNPDAVKPDFSPVESPHQYKQQSLKNIFLLLLLDPFIKEGIVNFIPDPCCFDQYLHRQMMDMAENRRGRQDAVSADFERFEEIFKNDFFQTIQLLPRKQRLIQIEEAMPELPSEQVERLLDYMEKQHKENPFSILQEDAYREGGQLIMTSLAPNFEMSLFVAQVTGSLILTDSPTRWSEFSGAQNHLGESVQNIFAGLSSIITQDDYRFCANPEASFHHCFDSDFCSLRNIFREIYLYIRHQNDTPESMLIGRLNKNLQDAKARILKKQLAQEDFCFNVKMNCLIPSGGFSHNNVQRLLLKSGSEKHLSNVPMAIFLEQT
jgi:hypothetical protein